MVEKYYSLALLAVGGMALSQSALAQRQEDAVGLNIDGAIDVRSVENAGLQPDSEESVSEIQTIASLGANGRLEGSWAEFVTDYSVEDRRYSEFDEENERLILGDSVLTLGPQDRRYYLQLSHSSREVSLNPLIADRPANRDNRVFLSGVLYGSLRPGDGNTLGLWIGATDIQFDESKENEATRYNAGAAFERQVSPLSRAGLSASGYELKYQNLDDSDLRYSRLAALWRTELRRLSYGFEIGGNRIETDTDSKTSPSVALNLAYTSGPQSMTVSYNQYLSDTSQGAQATSDLAPITEVEVDGRLSGVVDQFKLQQFAVTWAHAQVCTGCGLRMNFGVDEERYVTFPEFDSREISAGLLFSYRATAAVMLSMRGDFRSFEEVNREDEGGYDQTSVDFTVGFPRIVRDGELDLLFGGVRRDFNAENGYESTYVGLRFRYQFYDR